MHAVIRKGPLLGLVVLLLAPMGATWAVTAGVGRPAPDVEMSALRPGAESIDLADHRGKVVYLDFWSSWCAPCRRAMPQLDALRREFPREDFEVIGVNVDPEAADARRFLESTPVRYPLASDPDGSVAARFGVVALPALVVIDRRGVVRRAMTGADVEAYDELRSTLEYLIRNRGEVQ